MIDQIAQLAPKSLVQWLGRAQFRYPLLKPIIGWAGNRVRHGEHRLRHGVGKGLLFDPAGGNPGYALGTSDEAEQGILEATLRPGDMFFDVGANKGFFSLLAGRLVGGEGSVCAFEPFPGSVATARKNLRANGMDHARVFQMAVSDHEGKAQFVIERDSVHFHLHGAGKHVEQSDAAAIEVDVVTLDGLAEHHGLRAPRMIKIDVEGSEIEVLKGAAKTIERSRPVILCEVHWLGEPFLAYVRQFIEPMGYDVRTIDGEALPAGSVRYHALMRPKAGMGPVSG